MPKSKRDKKISLTKTSKKGVQLKQQIIEDVKTCVEIYKNIFLFTFHNMRNNKLKDIRAEWQGSRFFFGKNKIVALAFGKSKETEISDGISELAVKLKGQCALLFTNEKQKKVLSWMEEYAEEDYARSGFESTETVVLPAGPLEDFAHSIEPHLRQLGLPTTLQKGAVTLLQEYKVCSEGQTLTPEQCKILQLIGKKLATFKLIPLGVYSKKNGYKQINVNENGESMEVNETEP